MLSNHMLYYSAFSCDQCYSQLCPFYRHRLGSEPLRRTAPASDVDAARRLCHAAAAAATGRQLDGVARLGGELQRERGALEQRPQRRKRQQQGRRQGQAQQHVPVPVEEEEPQRPVADELGM